MTNPNLLPERERIAHLEVGRTDVTPALARILTAVFLATVLVVPAVQVAVGDPTALGVWRLPAAAWRSPAAAEGGPFARAFGFNRALGNEIDAFEDRLEERSVVAAAVRPWVRWAFTCWLGAGAEQVVPGRDGWLFYRPAVEHLTGRGFVGPPRGTRADGSVEAESGARASDPVAAIVGFRDQLAERGVRLLVVPVPVKAAIHPERLSSRLSPDDAPMSNRSFGELVRRLEAEGVDLLDPSPALAALAAETGEPVFLATDTHWTPAAADAVAARIASRIAAEAGLGTEARDGGLGEVETTVRGSGDLVGMLGLPEHAEVFEPEAVVLRRVVAADGSPIRPRRGAEVMLLGDSFANIYSQEGLGWGSGAGLGERLALHLGAPIDAILRNDDGAFATRLELAHQLADDSRRLDGTRVVVWELTARELSLGDWRDVPLADAAAGSSSFVTVARGGSVDVVGTVVAAAENADPASAPYADYVRAIHLVDVAPADAAAGRLDGDAALVFVPAMEERRPVWGSRLAVGERVRLRLSPWSEAPEAVRGASRGELLEGGLAFETPLLGEEVSP